MYDIKLVGTMLRMMRINRDWSQEMLCSGICAVSYLSKIEQGRVQPNEELIQKLFQRLEIPWQTVSADEGHKLCDHLYEVVFSDDTESIERSKESGILRQEASSLGELYPDYLVLRAYCCKDIEILPKELIELLDPRQRCLLYLLEDRPDDAMHVNPCALSVQRAGIKAYKEGKYTAAIELLEKAYEMAADQGYAKIMMFSKFYAGNCYFELQNIENTLKNYVIAKRLAKTLNNEDLMNTIEYNIASAAVENGNYEEGYTYFSQKEVLTILDAHKLSVCCEKTGRRVEAIAVLNSVMDKADGIYKKMCEIVLFRLKNKFYLQDAEYGNLLMRTFAEIQNQLPIGYARFHLPWVEEWCITNRQYKRIYEIMRSFPKC